VHNHHVKRGQYYHNAFEKKIRSPLYKKNNFPFIHPYSSGIHGRDERTGKSPTGIQVVIAAIQHLLETQKHTFLYFLSGIKHPDSATTSRLGASCINTL